MLLQRLSAYAARLPHPAPTAYEPTPIRYYIELDGSGRLVNRHPRDTANPKDPKAKRGQRRPAPQAKRTVGIKPLLFADKADYILGFVDDDPSDGKKPNAARVAACHRASLDLLDRCAEATGEPAVRAIQSFLHGDPLDELILPDNFDPSCAISFEVDGECPIDLPSVQAFWAGENDPSARDAPTMQCLVCGQPRPVLGRLQGSIKGVPGGQTSGTAIISANAEAFESYGLEASLIAPTCATCGERFTRALNDLLRDEARHIRLGGTAFVFWTRKEVGFSLRHFFDNPQAGEVRELIDSVRSGRSMPGIDETAFYAAVLSGSGARAVVRDWIDTTIGTVRGSLAGWFTGQRIVGPFGEEPRPLGLYALAAATVRDAQKDLAPPTIRTLLHAALSGTPLPDGLLAQAVRRSHAEGAVTRQRAALIKLVLRGQPRQGEDLMIQLDEENTSPAYRCGRLLAVLEATQEAALGRVNATIVDRFYGSASTAPGSVFPRLLRGAQPHLSKLERDRRGAYVALQRRLEGILAGVTEFPTTLTLHDQGLFSLGYYHQRAFDRAQARAASERRKAGLPPATPDQALGEALPATDATLDATDAQED